MAAFIVTEHLLESRLRKKIAAGGANGMRVIMPCDTKKGGHCQKVKLRRLTCV